MRKILFVLLIFNYCLISFGQSPTWTVSGTVTDYEGQLIPGANVILKGTAKGTVTNIEGKYSIKVDSETALLNFSFVGYLTEGVEVKGQSITNVVLIEDIQTLDEVVVVGYGVQKKESSVVAISQIEGDELKKAGAVSLSNALTGQVQGVFAVQSDGEPGSDAAGVFIRGKSSWVSNSPLVLVDGIEGNFNDIAPVEFETLSVLKDASATAMFGVKGANGVILITTKRGKEKGVEVSFNSEFGFKNPLLNRNMYDSYNIALIMNEAYKNDGSWDLLIPDDVLEHYQTQDMPYIYPNTDCTYARSKSSSSFFW